MSKPEITIPNNANNERLNKFVLLFKGALSNISGNVVELIPIADVIHIISKRIITAADVSLSLKKPPICTRGFGCYGWRFKIESQSLKRIYFIR